MPSETLTREQTDLVCAQLDGKPVDTWLRIELNGRPTEAKQRVRAGVLWIQLRQTVPRTIDGQARGTAHRFWTLNTSTRVLTEK